MDGERAMKIYVDVVLGNPVQCKTKEELEYYNRLVEEVSEIKKDGKSVLAVPSE